MARHADDLYERDELDPESLVDEEPDEFEDFDAFWADYTATEKREQTRIMGRLVPVPLDMPLEMQQRIQDADVHTDESEIRDLVAELFGSDLLDEWIDAGMTTRQFGVILAWAMVRAQGKRITFREVMAKIEAGEQGKAQGGPNRQQRRAEASRTRSRGTGARSSRTSAANTDSPRAR